MTAFDSDKDIHSEVVFWKRAIAAQFKSLPIISSSKDVYLIRRWLRTLNSTADKYPYFKELVIEGADHSSLDLKLWDVPEDKVAINLRTMSSFVNEIISSKAVDPEDDRYEDGLPDKADRPHQVYLWLVEQNNLQLKAMFAEFFNLKKQLYKGALFTEDEIDKKYRLFKDLEVFLQLNYKSLIFAKRLKFGNEVLINKFDKLISGEYKKFLDGEKFLSSEQLLLEIEGWDEYNPKPKLVQPKSGNNKQQGQNQGKNQGHNLGQNLGQKQTQRTGILSLNTIATTIFSTPL